MAIYYLDVKPIGGNSCRSAVGAAAYREGKKLYNQKDGTTHDYTKRRGSVGAAAYRSGDKLNDGNIAHDFTQKSGIVYNEIMLPEHAPREYFDSSTLWNAAEKAERNWNARTGREIVVALPNELTPEQQIEVLRDYIQRNFVNEGMCAGFSIHSGHIHEKKGEIYPFQDLTVRKDNPHAHIQLTVRPLNKDGTWGEKSKKEYILDKNGDKIKLPSGNWKSRKIELTDWDKVETLLKWREDWAVTINKEFERLGIDERISHLSLKAQGINREPTKHMGHEAWNLEKKGIKTKIGDENRAIMTRNKALEQLEKEIRKHEPSTHEKSASTPTEQGLNYESATHITPENTAEYMHELKQGYVILNKEIYELKEQADDAQHEIYVLNQRADEITEYAENIGTLEKRLDESKTERKEMGFFKSKKAIDSQIQRLEKSHKLAEDYFEHNFNITPKESAVELKRLEFETKEMELIKERLLDQLAPLVKEKEHFKLEYQRQKLLAEINVETRKIQYKLKQLDKEYLAQDLSPKEHITMRQIERELDTITEQDFQEILKEVSPEKVNALIEQRERIRDYDRIREYTRSFVR